MPWFTDALQEVRVRGSGLKEKVRDSARAITVKTQEAVAGNLQAAPPLCSASAREAEAHLEDEARCLATPSQAAEVVRKWVSLMQSSPPPRYADRDGPASGSFSSVAATREGTAQGCWPPQLTFRQVFLRCRALERALDATARAPELRASLREHALAVRSEEARPEEVRTPSAAFAHAFVALLKCTVGPPEVWLGTLGALLSCEKAIA